MLIQRDWWIPERSVLAYKYFEGREIFVVCLWFPSSYSSFHKHTQTQLFSLSFLPFSFLYRLFLSRSMRSLSPCSLFTATTARASGRNNRWSWWAHTTFWRRYKRKGARKWVFVFFKDPGITSHSSAHADDWWGTQHCRTGTLTEIHLTVNERGRLASKSRAQQLSKIPPVAHRTPVDVFAVKELLFLPSRTISFPNE